MNTRRNKVVALAAISLFSASSFAVAQQSPAVQADPPAAQAAQAEQQAAQIGEQTNKQVLQQVKEIAQDPQTAPDKLFLLNAGIDSTAEIAYSRQAQQKAQSEQVKQLAAKFIQDHEQLNQRLQQTAQQLGVQVPQALPRMKQEEIAILSSLQGKDFDQQYLAHMDAHHAMDVACFRAASSLSKNPQVKQFASESLPMLEHHHHMVREVAGSEGILPREDEATPAASRIPGSTGAANQGTTPGTGAGSGSASGNTSSGSK